MSDLVDYLATLETTTAALKSSSQVMAVNTQSSGVSLTHEYVLDSLRELMQEAYEEQEEDAECFATLTDQRQNVPGGKPFQKKPPSSKSWKSAKTSFKVDRDLIVPRNPGARGRQMESQSCFPTLCSVSS